ncbi:hypothetical protein [uncultured Sphingomonas sp.]|uniref:hypothetical protein n=1 Tax=uncultured Sphingomonas sp. TaxID=158754 RepID=UPI0035CB9FAC
MIHCDFEAIRAQVRAMDFMRGTPEQVAQWREDDEESRADLVIEGMIPMADEDALFELMLEEAVPPSLVSTIVGKLIHESLA